MLEIGCGVGNSLFPLLSLYKPLLVIYGLDFSPRAIEMIKKSPKFDEEFIKVKVCDIVKDEILEVENGF